MKAVQSRGELELFVDVGWEDQFAELDSCCFFWSSLDSELHGGHLMLSHALAGRFRGEPGRCRGGVITAWEVGGDLSIVAEDTRP